MRCVRKNDGMGGEVGEREEGKKGGSKEWQELVFELMEKAREEGAWKLCFHFLMNPMTKRVERLRRRHRRRRWGVNVERSVINTTTTTIHLFHHVFSHLEPSSEEPMFYPFPFHFIPSHRITVHCPPLYISFYFLFLAILPLPSPPHVYHTCRVRLRKKKKVRKRKKEEGKRATAQEERRVSTSSYICMYILERTGEERSKEERSKEERIGGASEVVFVININSHKGLIIFTAKVTLLHT